MKKDEIFEKVTAEIHRYFSPNAKVIHNHKATGKSGITRQIDVYIEDKIATYPLTIIVDCKYYSKKVDINDVDQVWGLVDDVRGNLGVIVSNAGFTKGALQRAKELGRLKLCSILDLENADFSIKISLPVICEFRKPLYQFSISATDPNMSLYPNPHMWVLEHKANGKIVSVYNEFLDFWNSDKISHEIGSHVVDFQSDEWVLIGPYGKFNFDRLQVKYDVVPRFYLGFVPIVEGKGIVDIQEHALSTRGFTMDKIDVVDVESKWEKFERLEEIKTKPFMHLVASDTFRPFDTDKLSVLTDPSTKK